MSTVDTFMVDEKEVGTSGNEFFTPDTRKRRIALIPAFISVDELDPTDEMKKEAEGDDAVKSAAAKHTISRLGKMKAALEAGATKIPPTAKSVELSERKGFLYARTSAASLHYVKALSGNVICKAADYKAAGRELEPDANGLRSPCCQYFAKTDNKQSQGGPLKHMVVIVEYTTNEDGGIRVLPKEAQEKLDDEHTLDFEFGFRLFELYDGQMRAWKEYNAEFPLMTSDFTVYKKQQGATQRLQIDPCNGPALWTQRGAKLTNRVISDAQPKWAKTGSRWKDLTLAEMDELIGVTGGGAVAANTEENFGGLLGGDS